MIQLYLDEDLTYTDKNGNEKDIDNDLVKKSPFLGIFGEKEHWENRANDYELNLPVDGSVYQIENKGYTANIKPLFGTLKNPVVEKNARVFALQVWI